MSLLLSNHSWLSPFVFISAVFERKIIKKTARSHTHTSNETNHIVKVANVALLGNKISFQNCNTFAVLRRRNENDAKPILFAFVSLCWFSIMFYWLLRSICFVNFNQNKRKNNYIFVRRKTNEVEHLETDIMRFDEREKKQAAIQLKMSDMYQLLFVQNQLNASIEIKVDFDRFAL